MLQMFLIASRSLFQHQRRTFLLGAAIAGVTALLIILMGLSVGMREIMLRSATTLMTGHVNVGGFYKVTSGQSAPVVVDAPKVMEIVRRDVPELDYAVMRGRGWAKLISDEGSMQVGIGGLDIAHEPGFRKVIEVKEGSLDDLGQDNTIMIFEEQAKKLSVKVGDTMTFSAQTPRGTNNTLDVRLVAIARNIGLMSSFNVFLNEKALRTLYQGKEGNTGAVLLYLKNIDDVPVVQARLRKTLVKEGFAVMENDPKAFWMKFETVNREDWTGQKLDITNWEDEISFIKWTVTALTGLSVVLIAILMIIICVGIMNIMWITIRERTREIGTLRAIGMQRSRVVMMFLTEGFLLGLFGTVVGAVLGLGASAVINLARIPVPIAVQLFLMTDHLSLAPTALLTVLSIAFITFCITAITLIPSFLAARMKPINAMHHVG